MSEQGQAAGESVAIIGSGVGGYIAWALGEAGRDVTLCLRTPFEALRVEPAGTGQLLTAKVKLATSPDQAAPVDWVLVTTKAHETRSAEAWLRKLVGPRTIVVLIQNGTEHAERVAGIVPESQVLPALVYISAERIGPGHVIHHGGRKILLAPSPQAARFAAMAQGAAVDVVQHEDFLTALWQKVLGNLAMNPITALTLRRFNVLRDPDLRQLTIDVLTEGVKVAQAEGAKVSLADVDSTIALFDNYDPEAGSSMLYDRLADRPMEQEYINGAVVRAAARHGIPVPCNKTLLALLNGLERGPRASLSKSSVAAE